MRQLTAQRDAGLRVILVTGRCLEDLDRDFADVVAAVEAVVAQNGALLRIDGEVEELQPPVSTQVRDALGRAGITFRPGRVILDCRADDALAIAGILGDLGSDVQAIRNRGQLMLLPAGVTKASGLAAALHALGISPHNTMAVGDAENDLAMLHLAEVAVAVANALPAVLEAADLVLPLEAGAGVQSLLTHPILTGEARMTIPRRDLRIGETAAGQPVTVPAADANILITGESGSGKSHLAGLLIERWLAAGYSALIIDLEGDYLGLDHLTNVVVLGGEEPPVAVELMALLRQAGVSAVVDLTGVAPQRMPDYLEHLADVIAAERAEWGLPHWIVLDEAQAFAGAVTALHRIIRPSDRGYCVITYRPQDLRRDLLHSVDIQLTPLPSALSSPHEATIVSSDSPSRRFVMDPRRTRHVRHWHKYTTQALPEDLWFTFTEPSGKVIGHASTIAEFVRGVRSVDAGVIWWHLSRGDFSRWLAISLGDPDPAALAATTERDAIARHAADIHSARRRLLALIEDLYRLDPAPEADAEPEPA